MMKLIRGLIYLTLLAIAVAVFAPNFIPADIYKPRVQQAVSDALGRDVTMAGDIRFQFFPTIDVVVEDVTIANVPGGKAPAFAQMDEMAVGIDLSSLLSGAVSVDRFTLTRPRINIEVDSKGHGNWEFEGLAGDAEPATSSTAEPSGTSAPDDGFAITTITFGDIRLVDGQVSYATRQGTEEFSDINLTLGLASLDDPMQVDGSLGYKGEPVKMSLALERPRFITDGGKSEIDLALDSTYGEGSFKGTVTQDNAQNISLAGATEMDISSVGALMDYLTGEKNGLRNLKALKLSGALSGNTDKATFNNINIKLNDMSGSGNVVLDMTAKKPYLSGALALDKLDFNDLMGGAPSKAAKGTGQGSGKGSGQGTGQGTGQGNGQASASDWDETPMDLSALRSFNADLSVTADQLFFQDLSFGQSDVAMKLRGGVLTSTLKKIDLYKGSGSGQLTLDARKAVTQITSQFTLDNLATLPFLTDALGLDRIEGLGSFSYDVSTRGKSQKQWVRNLQGTSKLKVIDGAWRGVNLADMSRSLQSFLGKTTNDDAGQESVGDNEKTDFAELGGNFAIQNGVVQNTDFNLLNPFVRVSGKGSINLLQQNVSFRLKPKFVNSAVGQGGNQSLEGLSVPILVKGPWTNISYQADFGSIIGEALLPGSGVEEPEDLLKGVLENVLGGGKSKSKSEAESADASKDAKAAKTTEPQKALTKEERQKKRQEKRRLERQKQREQEQQQEEDAKPEDVLRDFLKDALSEPKDGDQ